MSTEDIEMKEVEESTPQQQLWTNAFVADIGQHNSAISAAAVVSQQNSAMVAVAGTSARGPVFKAKLVRKRKLKRRQRRPLLEDSSSDEEAAVKAKPVATVYAITTILKYIFNTKPIKKSPVYDDADFRTLSSSSPFSTQNYFGKMERDPSAEAAAAAAANVTAKKAKNTEKSYCGDISNSDSEDGVGGAAKTGIQKTNGKVKRLKKKKSKKTKNGYQRF